MRLKTVFAAVLCGALLAGSGGCSVTDLSSEDMLRPPKTMGDEAEIEQLISKTAPKGYTLKYPKNGAYRSAIIMHDLNGDNVDESIAFFRDKDGVAGIHMLVMYEQNGKWSISDDFVTDTTDVDSVDFADINGNGSLEIVVGYATYTANLNFLSAYSFAKGKTGEIASGQTYSAFYCGNLDSSGKSKVITLTLFSPENEAKATLLEYDESKNALYAKASAAMDPGIVSYKNVVFSDIDENTKGLFVDGMLSNNEINTQIVYFNKSLNVLRNPLYKEKTDNPTRRSGDIVCADIGNDMKYEIPTVSTLPYYESGTAFSAAEQLVWNSFSVEKEILVPVQLTAANYSFGYTIKIPVSWTPGAYTAFLNKSGDEMSFYEWNKTGVPGEQLFDIKVFKVSDWDSGKGMDNYTLIYKDNRYAYTFINYHSDSLLTMSDDEIKTAFSLLGGTASTKQNGN